MSSILSDTGATLSEHAVVVVAIIFGVIAIAAACMAAWPALHARSVPALARGLLAASLAVFVLGTGIGTYLYVGAPELARRAIAAPEAGGVPGLVSALALRLRGRPGDVTGWTLLGRGYLTLSDPGQAAIAFRHAAQLASPRQKPELLSAYGEALTLAAGSVTPESEAAFQAALALHPKDFAARYYLGQLYAERRDTARALALWGSLLADSPGNAPWRANLVDRMAALQAQSGGTPDISAMVGALALRLQARPDDLQGWQRLLRAYVVLGEMRKARSALASAQVAMQGNPVKRAGLDAEARSLKLEK